MKRVGVIVGSVRENRTGIKVGKWVLSKSVKQNVEYVLVDLKEVNLPHYNEPSSPRSSKEYTFETTRNWSRIVSELDGFIFVTPEYNGFFPGSVKDAVDYLYHEWAKKPYAIVGYGGSGGKGAAGKLSELLDRFDMQSIGFIGIQKPWEAVDTEGNINPDFVIGDINKIFSDLNNTV